jgi:hypothetical protein
LGRNIFPLRVWEGKNKQEPCDNHRLYIFTLVFATAARTDFGLFICRKHQSVYGAHGRPGKL